MDLLERISSFCERLENASITYSIGGSVASGVWGEPRQTNDVDIEVWLTEENLESFRDAFGEDYLMSHDSLNAALDGSDPQPMVQVLELDGMLRFDCFAIGPEAEFETECLRRSQWVELVPGRPVRVASAEAILVKKLRWFDLGNPVSERQWRDAKSIVAVSELDRPFVESWSNTLGVADLLQELRSPEAQ